LAAQREGRIFRWEEKEVRWLTGSVRSMLLTIEDLAGPDLKRGSTCLPWEEKGKSALLPTRLLHSRRFPGTKVGGPAVRPKKKRGAWPRGKKRNSAAGREKNQGQARREGSACFKALRPGRKEDFCGIKTGEKKTKIRLISECPQGGGRRKGKIGRRDDGRLHR